MTTKHRDSGRPPAATPQSPLKFSVLLLTASVLLGGCQTLGSGPASLFGSADAGATNRSAADPAQASASPQPEAIALAADSALAPKDESKSVAIVAKTATQPAAAASPVSAPEPVEVETTPPEPAVAAEPTPPASDLWMRIEAGFAIADIEHKLVDRHMKWYLDRPDYLRRMIDRSRRYLHFVVEELDRRKLPTELALLPMIESAYNPFAHSRARAAGMWQFIPSTGKRYGLEQDWWADERRDVISSTRAALDYLERIYEMHGDWHLALASYNWGEGAVKRAVAKNRRQGLPTDYAYLRMPAETRGYVPKLQAIKNILRDADTRARIGLPSIPDEPYFVAIERPEEMDVKLAAEFAEIPIEEFVALNPAHNRPILRTDIPLLLPRDHADRFLERVARHDEPFLSWEKYVFRKHDRLDKVARRFGISERQLRLANGLTGKRRTVKAGQQLMVPTQGAAVDDAMEVIAALPPFSVTDPPPKKRRGYYRKRTRLTALIPPAEARKAVKKKTAAKPAAKKRTGNTKG